MRNVLLVPRSLDPADAANLRAAKLCRTAGAELTLFDCVYEPHLEGYLGNSQLYAGLRDRLVAERTDALRKLAQLLHRDGCKTRSAAVWASALESAVSSYVIHHGIDLVVTAPGTGFASLTRRQWQMVSHCPVSVLVVNGDGTTDYAQIVAAVDPYHAHGKPPDLDAKILAVAESFRKLYNAKLTVRHCFTPIGEFAPDGFDQMPIAEAERALEAARRDALSNLIELAGLDASQAQVVAGRPADMLIGASRDGLADLIVVGSVSRGVIREFLLGSTAEKVVEQAACDVLVVKPPEFQVRFSM